MHIYKDGDTPFLEVIIVNCYQWFLLELRIGIGYRGREVCEDVSFTFCFFLSRLAFLHPYIFTIYFAFIIYVAVYSIVWVPEIPLPSRRDDHLQRSATKFSDGEEREGLMAAPVRRELKAVLVWQCTLGQSLSTPTPLSQHPLLRKTCKSSSSSLQLVRWTE